MVIKQRWDMCLSCGYRFCRERGKSLGGNHICPAPWGSTWWCTRLSAEAVKGSSWSFHLAANCSCLESVDKK